MKKSDAQLNTLKPGQLNSHGCIKAWFTLKNADTINRDQKIAGLNLGFNTGEKKSVVEVNRSALFDSIGVDKDRLAFAGQVHGNGVQVVSRGGTYSETDGMVTRVPGLTLAIQVADCAAVLIADPVGKVIAAVHAGWRGAAGDIIPIAVKLMVQEGAGPANMWAYVSPCISLGNFEVGAEVASRFPDRFVDYENYEKPHIDLKRVLKHQLFGMGIKEESIEVSEHCTIEGEDAFYSYRREKEQSGRMLGIIRLEDIGLD